MGFKPRWAGGPEDSVSPSQLCCCPPGRHLGVGWTSPSILLPHMKSQSREALMQPGLVPLTQGRGTLPVGWTGAHQGKPGRQRQCSGRGRQAGARSEDSGRSAVGTVLPSPCRHLAEGHALSQD